MKPKTKFSGIRWRIRCGEIVAVAWLALASSEAGAQITFHAGPNSGWERRVQWELRANGFSEDAANPSDVSSSPFLPFHGVANGTVSTSWINILGENASSGASGQLTQDSVLTSNSIVSSSSARFSAQFNNTGLSDRARAQGWSEGTLFFSLDQYCRFTLSGNVSANGSGVAEPNFNTGGNAGTFTSVSVGIGSLANVSGLIITGYGHLSDSLSAAVLTNGFLNAGDYILTSSLHAAAAVGPYGTGSAQGSASTFVSFTVEPMGTKLVGLEVIQTIQDWNNSVPLIAGKPTYVRAHVEPFGAPSVPIVNARLRGYDSFGQELAESPQTPMADSATTANPFAASVERRMIWQGSVNFQLPPSWTSNSVRLKMEMDGLVSGGASLEQYASFSASPQLDLRIVKVSVTHGSSPPSTAAIATEVTRLAEIFPITREAIHISETSMLIFGTDQFSAEEFLELIKLKRLEEGRSDIYVAAASGTLAGTLGGIADNIPGNIVVARIDTSGTLAHELGHVLGEFHTVNTQLFGVTNLRALPKILFPDRFNSLYKFHGLSSRRLRRTGPMRLALHGVSPVSASPSVPLIPAGA